MVDLSKKYDIRVTVRGRSVAIAHFEKRNGRRILKDARYMSFLDAFPFDFTLNLRDHAPISFRSAGETKLRAGLMAELAMLSRVVGRFPPRQG